MLYQEDMANMQCPCGKPGCEDPLYIHGKCHMTAPAWVKYFDGVLTVECSVCETQIAQFAVAKRPKEKGANDGKNGSSQP